MESEETNINEQRQRCSGCGNLLVKFPEGEACARCAFDVVKQLGQDDAGAPLSDETNGLLVESDAASSADEETQSEPVASQEQPTLLGKVSPNSNAASGDNEDLTIVPQQTVDSSQRKKRPVTFAVGAGADAFEHFEILSELGRGGMGVVYRALDERLGREVAVKMLLSGDAASSDEMERFETEARAVASLDHPGILPIFEVGLNQGRPYFSMPLVTGGSLEDRLENEEYSNEEWAELLIVICEAVQHAHDKEIIHRDLKPANILFDESGQPRITDFGLAKRLGEQTQMTATGQTLGTPSYMAPEQAIGKTNDVGIATDVYALGAILYVMLTGRPPFVGDSPLSVMMSLLDSEPELPSHFDTNVAPDLEAICLKCLEKKPADRYQSVSELREDLARFVNGEPVSVRRLSTFGLLRRWYRITKQNSDVRIQSKSRIFGLPWVSIAFGSDLENTEVKGVAKGIIAYGDHAYGVVAVGSFACGVFAFGQRAVGFFALGLVAVGVVSSGLACIGAVALGGLALGFCSMGAIAIGYYSLGFFAFGVQAFGAFARALR